MKRGINKDKLLRMNSRTPLALFFFKTLLWEVVSSGLLLLSLLLSLVSSNVLLFKSVVLTARLSSPVFVPRRDG